MTILSSRYAIGMLVLALAAAADDALSTPADSVFRLNSSNYESTVFHSGNNGMVLFYQAWCGHCRRFMSVWERLAQETNPTIFIASVDCGASAEADICRSSDVTTYPTLRYYLNRTEYDYRGSLSLDALHDFISSTLAVRCNPMLDVATCSEKARKYTTKWLSMETAKVRQEIERLELLMDRAESSATAELRRWMRERSDILKIILQHQTGQAKKESVQYGYEL